MKPIRTSLELFTLILTAAGAVACADPPLPSGGDAAPASGTPADLGDAKRLDARADHHWMYAGLLPALDEWHVVVSLAGHTARITGLLPAGYDAPLPYWAEPTARSDGRVELAVVYPIATARVKDERGAPTGAANATPGDYAYVSAYPYTPSDPVVGTPWGGFPYLEYDLDRHLALHGPITSENGSWRLLRGPVSHGCARMQGEHVVELAHLMGLDMGDPAADARGFSAAGGDFRVRVVEDFDRLPDGRLVDVDSPGTAGFQRPVGGPDAVAIFPTWSSDAFPRFVCAHDPARPLGDEHCDALPDTGMNPLRAAELGAIACPAGYSALTVGTQGGRICTDGVNAWGPFTRAMTALCSKWGGGANCSQDRWSLALARNARGVGVCPRGAALDARDTGYCVEGQDAFGPFPPEYVAACEAAGGGRACRSARWGADFLRRTIARVGRRTVGTP